MLDLKDLHGLQRLLNARLDARLEEIEFDHDAISKRKREVERAMIMRDSYFNFKDSFSDESHRFGCAPVRHDYFRIVLPSGPYTFRHEKKKKEKLTEEVIRYYHDKLFKPSTVTFKRYPNLLPDVIDDFCRQDTIVQVFLGFEEILGYKFMSGHGAILNEGWQINLRTTEPENLLMEAFLGWYVTN